MSQATRKPGSPAFAAALSTAENATDALDEVCDAALAALGDTPDLAVAFVSPHHDPDDAFAARLADRCGATSLLGSTGESIVGGAREIERSPAVSLWLARLPGASVQPMWLRYERTPEGGSVVGWPDELPETWPQGAALLLLGEPFSFPTDVLLDRLNEDRPGVPVFGGMASGSFAPGQNRLLYGPRVVDQGAVAALIHGDVSIRTVVSQGCRPIGRPLVITKAERNVIQELGGKPPLVQLKDLYPELSPREQQLVQRGLHVGRVLNEYRDTFGRGDFLVRNVMSADPETGAIAIGDFVRPGQTVQFHVRDSQSADEDLRELLAGAPSSGGPRGGLLFTCNGRGTHLFDEPDHDAAAIGAALGQIPLAGFFAQGEIGPIGGANFVHGFTASLALFEGREDSHGL